MGVLLEIVNQPELSIEAECLNPSIAGLHPEEILRLTVWQGRERPELGDFFRARKIETDEELTLHLEGDLRRVKRVGEKTTEGHLVVHGDCGMHFCEGIAGGAVEVHGDIGNWSLCMMRGGVVRIFGNAGAFMAASLPGDARGMKGETIWVRGDVGSRMAERMRRGLIVVGGAVGEFCAAEMIAGTVVSLGRIGARAGASMKRGTIVVMGEHEPLSPGFEAACTYTPTFMGLLGRELQRNGLIDDAGSFTGAKKKFTRWCGDKVSLGKGEVLICE